MNLFRNFATVGMATLTSRLLGFVRDVVMAMMLGSGPTADAFFVAFRLPNLFRRLFAEGAFNSAFVPLFARAVEEDGDDGARRFAEEILAGLLLVLGLFTAVALIAAPGFVWVLAPGFASDAEKFALTTELSRIMFPYLACMSLTAMVAGMLQTYGRFALAAFAPSLLNVLLIAGMGLIWWQGSEGGREAAVVLSWSVFIAGIAQLGAVWFGLRMLGVMPRLVRPRMTVNVRRLLALGLPGLLAGGITQVNIVIGTAIASMQESAVSYLAYADRLYQLPLGVVGVAIGVVLLPDISRQLRSATPETASTSMNRALEFATALTLPAAVALAVIPTEIIHVLFERGAFTAEDTAATAAALAGFAIGLPAFVLIKVLSPGFFAREDTKTPMIYSGVSIAVNIVASLALFPVFAHVGIAIATSLSGWVNAGLLAGGLWRRGWFRLDGTALRRLPLLTLAAALMGAVLSLGAWRLAGWIGSPDLELSVASLGALCLGAGLVYAVVVHVTGVVDARRFLGLLRRRRRG
ncbi:murein biosynthesis integral membrane protein MurJ [Methylobrevis albus]|uniref:Probable lipid II flippase MurJ n=1 Tax=Methylobrevis albus TaxID=2793297 RepID=A0A931I4A5_9HYPH|nr:murein biosynthesis integral membrane protein MurJ [Methylobrevis albus]MBH0238626.1 murein biosynthesis integral membrane protein MurJ [Methylobrevis albus]